VSVCVCQESSKLGKANRGNAGKQKRKEPNKWRSSCSLPSETYAASQS